MVGRNSRHARLNTSQFFSFCYRLRTIGQTESALSFDSCHCSDSDRLGPRPPRRVRNFALGQQQVPLLSQHGEPTQSDLFRAAQTRWQGRGRCRNGRVHQGALRARGGRDRLRLLAQGCRHGRKRVVRLRRDCRSECLRARCCCCCHVCRRPSGTAIWSNPPVLCDRHPRAQIHTQAYHSDVSATKKQAIHRSWMRNQTQVVVATIAFGLG